MGAHPSASLGVATNGTDGWLTTTLIQIVFDKASLASGLFFSFKAFVPMTRLALRIYKFVCFTGWILF